MLGIKVRSKALKTVINQFLSVLDSSFGERLPSLGFFLNDGITGQILWVFKDNSATSFLQTFNFLLVLVATTMPGDVTVPQ